MVVGVGLVEYYRHKPLKPLNGEETCCVYSLHLAFLVF